VKFLRIYGCVSGLIRDVRDVERLRNKLDDLDETVHFWGPEKALFLFG